MTTQSYNSYSKKRLKVEFKISDLSDVMTYNRRAGQLVGPPIKHYDELKKKETEKNKTALKNKKNIYNNNHIPCHPR